MRYVIIVLCLLFAGQLQAAPPAALTVSTVSPVRQKVEQTVSGTGYIEAKETAMINARLNGAMLREIKADLGDRVEKGQVLARFDDAVLRTDIAVAKAQVAQAEIVLRQAKKNAARAKSLLKSSAMSQMDGERLLDAAQNAQAALNIAKARLNAGELQLTYTEVKAPVSGVITDKKAVLGATVAIGTPLFEMMVGGIPAWRAQVPLADIAQIHTDTPAEVTLPDGTKVQGRVYNIAPTVSRQSREATVFVRLEHNPGIRAGMMVAGQFQVGRAEKMLIPDATVQPADGHNYVWLVRADNTVHRQPVILGQHLGAMVEVRSGLSDDSRLVARGGSFLAEGNTVHVVDVPGAKP